uniref:Uncharacterized protein n=1 Tax=Panagrolaimus superbus TaxID=310955 RepID=A0A914ZC45_9BILA
MKSFRYFCGLVDSEAPVEAIHDALKNNDLDIANQLVLLGLFLPYGKSGTTWEDLAARLQFIYFAAISVANFGTYAVIPEMKKCNAIWIKG